VWATTISGISLLVAAFLWIVLDYARSIVHTHSLQLGANQSILAILEAGFAFSPFILLASWGMFVIIVANATRGGDQYV